MTFLLTGVYENVMGNANSYASFARDPTGIESGVWFDASERVRGARSDEVVGKTSKDE